MHRIDAVDLDGSRSHAATARAPVAERLLAGSLERRSAVDDIVGRVGVSVDLGLLKPLERLPSDVELANAFGVAPITIRRALTRLCSQGVLVRRRGRGGGTFVVSDPPRDVLLQYELERAQVSREIWELLDYRFVLEAGAVYIAAETASDADVRELRELVRAMDAAEDWAAFRPLDPCLHLAIARVAGSERAVAELTALFGRLSKLYFPYPIDYLRASNREHGAIVDAVADHDPLAACRAVRRHILEAKHAFSWITAAGRLDTNRSG